MVEFVQLGNDPGDYDSWRVNARARSLSDVACIIDVIRPSEMPDVYVAE